MNIILTDDQIRTLSDEAGAHGDLEMVAICQRALAGDAAAIAECARVIKSRSNSVTYVGG